MCTFERTQVRPSQVYTGTIQWQVGNIVKVMFDEPQPNGGVAPAWYQGEITTFDYVAPEDGKPKE